MRGGFRIATMGLVLVTALAALTSTAGAASAPSYTVSANGGFISLSLLNNAVGLSGAGSAASAGSGVATDASGTGLCLEVGSSSNPCPTSATSALPTSALIDTTQRASAAAAGSTGTPTPASGCLLPTTSVVLVTLNAACGTASASQDASGNPTASSEGNLANLSVGLGSLTSLSGLTGTLCSAGSPATASGTVSTLLGDIDTLLSGAGLPPLTGSLTSVCAILTALSSTAGGLAGGLSTLASLLSSLTGTSALLTVEAGKSDSTITHSTDAANGDNLETVTAVAQGVDISLLGLLTLQITPNSTSVTIDTTTGIVQQPTAQTGVLSIAVGSAAPTVIPLPDLSSTLQGILTSLGLSGVINPQLTTVAESTTSLSSNQRTGTANSADLNLNLLGGLVVLNIGDASVSASSVAAVPASTVTPTPTPVPTAAPTPVPGVTTVHTGEFFAGWLPIVLIAGMGLGGLMLITRRRMFSAARSFLPFARHSTSGSAGGLPPGPASGTSSVPPPVSGPARRQSSL
jgi:hypothetical protein